jgi:hypothetical protein
MQLSLELQHMNASILITIRTKQTHQLAASRGPMDLKEVHTAHMKADTWIMDLRHIIPLRALMGPLLGLLKSEDFLAGSQV